MKKEKKSKKVDEVYKKDEKYHCTECHTEVPVKQACPKCGKEIDWDRVRFESRVF